MDGFPIHPNAIRDERRLKTAVSVNDQSTAGLEHHSDAHAWNGYANGIALDFSRPGKPTDKACVESFNPSVRSRRQGWS
jgi:transposase InsO family protein